MTRDKRKPLKWRDTLKIVTMRGDDFVCAYCFCELDLDTAEVDHIVPRVRGGGEGLDNLEISCRSCNRFKATKPLDEELVEELKYGVR